MGLGGKELGVCLCVQEPETKREWSDKGDVWDLRRIETPMEGVVGQEDVRSGEEDCDKQKEEGVPVAAVKKREQRADLKLPDVVIHFALISAGGSNPMLSLNTSVQAVATSWSEKVRQC